MENVLFRQTFRGFDRRQVLEYIDNLSAQMAQQADDYTNLQKGLESEIQTLSQQLSEKRENLALSRDISAKLKEELDYLKQNNTELKRQITSYRNMILEKEREISRIKQDYRKLSDHSEELEKENAGWKAKQDEIAVCMVEASVRAREIIENATQQAEKTKAEFDMNAANLMGKVADVRTEISRLETQLEESFAKLSSAMENMDKASHVIENQVMEYRTKVDSLDVAPRQTVEEPVRSGPVKAKVVAKKSLTDSVLDTITKLLEK